MGRSVHLAREKETLPADGMTGGTEEFVAVDRIAARRADKFVPIAKQREHEMEQVLLAMENARDTSCGGVVYGFVSTANAQVSGGQFVNQGILLFSTGKTLE